MKQTMKMALYAISDIHGPGHCEATQRGSLDTNMNRDGEAHVHDLANPTTVTSDDGTLRRQ